MRRIRIFPVNMARYRNPTMNDEEEHKFEPPHPPPREKIEPKKPEKSSLESSNGTKKSSKSSSSSSSNHHHSSSSKQKHTNHLSSTNNHQSSSSNHNHHSSSSSSNHHHHSDHKHKEHKKSPDSKSSESKHHKSHHTSSSSSSSHKTSNSHKRSREDAESKENESKSKKVKSDHEKSDKKSNGSNDVKKSSPTSNGTSSKSTKKEHKSSTKRKHTEVVEQEFDGASGMGFAEALGMADMPSSSSSTKRPKHDQLADKITITKSSSSSSKSKSSSSSSKKEKEKDKPSTSSASSSSRPSTSKAAQNYTQAPKLLTQKPKLDLLSDIANELPSDVSIPEYRPVPLNSAMKDYINQNSNGTASTSRHTRNLTESELLIESFSSQKSRTRVFSGNCRARSEIPKLYELCLRVLTDNLDYVECTGGVPFDILRPALEKAKPDQLANIEYYNPYLLDDSDILWKPHCQRTWKNRHPAEMESWRDMYERCIREDAEKLTRLTKNIKVSQDTLSSSVQKTKMAFVDTMVKAPRGVARKQEQFGTANKPVVSPAARVESLRNVQPNLAVRGDVRLRVAAGLRDDAQQLGRGTVQRANLVKKAPMMAKILSKFKR
ncbi:hypothetical protein ACKWTF_010209 [Chironomus riparius]